jgi:hypothetical protein
MAIQSGRPAKIQGLHSMKLWTGTIVIVQTGRDDREQDSAKYN